MSSRFTDADDDENLIFRKVRDNIEIGICPMLYSFRIRAGVIGDGYCYLDYDAGKSIKEIEDVYSLVLSAISKRMDSGITQAPFIFKDFPIQSRRPMANDHECFLKLDELCGQEILSIYQLNIKEELQIRKIKWAVETGDKTNNPEFMALMSRMGFFDVD